VNVPGIWFYNLNGVGIRYSGLCFGLFVLE
jgi:hypothetical protein